MKLTPLGLSFLLLAAPACLDERIPLDRAADRDGAALEHDPDAPAPAAEAHLIVAPSIVDFGSTLLGTARVQSVVLLSAGTAPLVIDHMELSGHPGFSVELELPLTLAPAASHTFEVSYESAVAGPAAGLLTLHTNDPDAPDGHAVELRADGVGACIAAAPSGLEFADQRIGATAVRALTVTSCGDRELVIDSLAIAGPQASSFEVVVSPSLPLVLAAGATAELAVAYTPSVAGSDEAVLIIGSNVHNAAVPLHGVGFGGALPVAVIRALEGDAVTPGTQLHLDGSQSTADGMVVAWDWALVQPDGSMVSVVPSSTVVVPTITLWVVGRYTIQLWVTDERGERSEVASYEVVVRTTGGLSVELMWDTPGDPDQTDGGPAAGADLDLHLVHPFAADDGWFDARYDAFWRNPRQDWGGWGDENDAVLYRDDTDGVGPEGIEVAVPEYRTCYRVGVHVWDDAGFGASTATVRIFQFGDLVFEGQEQLEELDLWEVTSVCWPPVEGRTQRPTLVCEGTTTPCDDDGDCGEGGACGSHVTHDYIYDMTATDPE